MSDENPIVAANAVTPDALPLNELTLIGLMHQGDTASALLRSANGEITKVTLGDTLGRQTVAVISEDQLILIGPGGVQSTLHIPS